MAGTDEGSAFPEKLKPDLPISINVTPDEKIEVDEDNSISIEKQKVEISPENGKNDTLSFSVDDKLAESKRSIEICAAEKDEEGGDGKEDNTVDADGLKVEAEIFDWEGRFTAVEKGKGILIEESETDDDYCEDDSSDDFDSDCSEELDWDVEDDLFPGAD